MYMDLLCYNRNMKKLVEKISNNLFLGWLLSCSFIFFLTIWNTSLNETLIGSLFFGTLAVPITAAVIALIDNLLSQ